MEEVKVNIKKKVEPKTKFYEISQNNSGGSFVTNDKLCHRLFIEADSTNEATFIAEKLGCYWNGCDEGSDCPCCGDRWHEPYHAIDIDEMNKKWGGYEVCEWLNENNKEPQLDDMSIIVNFKTKYAGSTWFDEPIIEKKYGSRRVIGKIKVEDVEQYAQIMANLYGWTSPDCRIFYKDGTVKEIFTKK